MRSRKYGFRLPGDAVAIGAVLLIAVLVFLLQLALLREPETVFIRTETGEVTYPLHVDGAYTVCSAGHTLVVSVLSGEVSVTSSDCPGGDCMKKGVITRAGESIVCLPARVSITLEGGGDADVDIILP